MHLRAPTTCMDPPAMALTGAIVVTEVRTSPSRPTMEDRESEVYIGIDPG